MIRRVGIALLLLCPGVLAPVSAHSVDQGAMLLDFTDGAIDAEIQLPAERLQSVLGSTDPAAVSAYLLSGLSATLPDGRRFAMERISAPSLSRIDGAPYVIARVRFLSPQAGGTEFFELHSDLLVDRIPTQEVLVSIRTDWRTGTFADEPKLAGVLHASDRVVHVDRRRGSWWSGFGSIFRLGMRHIAEGNDHLLFLLILLLPAPVLVLCGRWMGYTDLRPCLLSIARIVTAFTVGHSVTLAAGAFNLIQAPSRPIEVLIACSILISAVHALRPLFPGREPVIAGCFGLVHGLAFSTALAELGLNGWDRAASLLSFNLGIETMQFLVVAATLPSLILLSRTRLYPAIRISGAMIAGAAAVTWIAQRLWDLPNPADPLLTALLQHAGWIAAGLTLLGLFARMSEWRGQARMTDPEL